VVDHANALSCDDFAAEYWNFEDGPDDDDTMETMELKYAADMSTAELLECLRLVEKTSRKDYEGSSWGWSFNRKRKEMKEKEMRYVILRDTSSRIEPPPMIGFVSFMLTHDSTPSMPVLYVYEIHLTEGARGKGYGKRLMHVARTVAFEVGVDKVMLTCFLSNTAALDFYRRLGFEKDVCSPGDRRTRNKVIKIDYVIMSQAVPDVDDYTDITAPPSVLVNVAPQVTQIPPVQALQARANALPPARLHDTLPIPLKDSLLLLSDMAVVIKSQGPGTKSMEAAIKGMRRLEEIRRSEDHNTPGRLTTVEKHLKDIAQLQKLINQSIAQTQKLLGTLMGESVLIDNAWRRLEECVRQYLDHEKLRREQVDDEKTRRTRNKVWSANKPQIGAEERLEKWFDTTIQAGMFRDLIKHEPMEIEPGLLRIKKELIE
jgi:RimJ/RimL family protein N-acetyltransferase